MTACLVGASAANDLPITFSPDANLTEAYLRQESIADATADRPADLLIDHKRKQLADFESATDKLDLPRNDLAAMAASGVVRLWPILHDEQPTADHAAALRDLIADQLHAMPELADLDAAGAQTLYLEHALRVEAVLASHAGFAQQIADDEAELASLESGTVRHDYTVEYLRVSRIGMRNVESSIRWLTSQLLAGIEPGTLQFNTDGTVTGRVKLQTGAM